MMKEMKEIVRGEKKKESMKKNAALSQKDLLLRFLTTATDL